MKNKLSMIPPGSTIGILGGGQLGKMIAIAATNLGYKTHIYCPEATSPALQVTNHSTIAPYLSQNKLSEFASKVDIITLEFENIPCDTIKFLNSQNKIVCPDWQSLYIAQNRLREKEFVKSLGIKTTKFFSVQDSDSLWMAANNLKFPFILKTLEQGYDGKGQTFINSKKVVEDAVNMINSNKDHSFIAEAWVDYQTEISVIIARNQNGDTSIFPCIENIHRQGILHTSTVPATIDKTIAKQAYQYAYMIAEKLELIGLLTIEFFVTKNGKLLVNEMSPRPHNSGHFTLDACITSQFEQLIRAICSLPFGSTNYTSKAIMTNLIGDEVNNWLSYIQDPNTKLHLYGKDEIKPGRKMGHFTTLYP
ncbi:N5-carboxyaminoimidazole ribonucleotide synthase [Rickettsiales bacterium Ac37b]|nr:N5-carboxyaminoimidazole ribonucleotide synthase [Rickettsiales bacterium Ac37b]